MHRRLLFRIHRQRTVHHRGWHGLGGEAKLERSPEYYNRLVNVEENKKLDLPRLEESTGLVDTMIAEFLLVFLDHW